jgi:hypothetical protein
MQKLLKELVLLRENYLKSAPPWALMQKLLKELVLLRENYLKSAPPWALVRKASRLRKLLWPKLRL